MKKNQILGIIISVLAIAVVGFYFWQSIRQSNFDELSKEPIADNRVQITNQQEAQYQSSVLINSIKKQSEFGSGYVVGKNTVVTNKHVIMDIQNRPEEAVVRVGHKDKNGEVNFVDFKIKNIITPEEESIDVAVLKLAPTEDGKTISNYRRIAEFGDSSRVKEGTVLTVVGFPGDKEYGTMWASTGEVDMMMESIISFKAVTAPGNSGSPMFDSEEKVVAMNNAGGETNSFGFLLDDQIVSFINKNIE